MQAVLMVAGQSTRTYPLTLTQPKPLLPVLNRPLIRHSLDQLVGLADEVILIVGYKKEMIATHLGPEYRGMRLIYQEQKEQLGTGHAVLQAAPHISGSCLVLNGDDLYAHEDMRRLLDFRFSALAMPVPDPSAFGVYQVDANQNVVRLVEKPREDLGNLVNVGCYHFDHAIFSELASTPMSERGEIELTSAIMSIAQREPFRVVSLEAYWLSTGYPWDLLRTQDYFFAHGFAGAVAGRVEAGARISGTAAIGAGSTIAEGATLIGPVCIGSGCRIGPDCRIGPNTTIGDNADIAAGTRIEHSIMAADVAAGPGCSISHSVIGSGVRIGPHCTLESRQEGNQTVVSTVKGKVVDSGRPELGAIVADGVFLAGRTRIAPGCKLWPGIHTGAGQFVDADLGS